MPTGDGRCGVCGYWHEPGGHHIGRLAEQPMRFPSRAERDAIARGDRLRTEEERQHIEAVATMAERIGGKVHERRRLIERCVLDLTWPSLRAQIATEEPVNPSFLLIGLAELVRARFREIAG